MAEEVIRNLVASVVKSLVDFTMKEVNYIRKCPENVAKLKDELQNLKDMREKRNHELPMFSDELIQGMKEVRVLDMSWCENQPLPQSFKFLIKLRTLNLQGNKSLHDISILAEMQVLEILILDYTGIKEIPQEIGQLVNLRRLSAIHCENLYHVAPGVISKLWRLEDLLIGFKWVPEGIYERIVEIMKLSKLTYLALHVPRFDVIPEGFNPRKLKGFFIQIGGSLEYFYHAANLKRGHLVIETHNVEIPFLKWLKQLTEASHRTDLNSIKKLEEYPTPANLDIRLCSSLEEVIWDGDEETSKSETEHSENIVFRSLAKINLFVSGRLERFYSGHSTIKYPSLVDVHIYVCPSMKMWGPGIHETPKLKFVASKFPNDDAVRNVQLDGPDATINDAVNKIYEEERRFTDESGHFDKYV
ncbi:NB-ARC domains-containing protein [Artemisia annua]|uniref:NB-ARC domains-containing protein n=1 Tax=Artemisia annua TaxID=35608 RepID=A0A2U1KV47_ARTAN|nr:NB-ARC domains-containing protein [Artemisia annua]